MVSQTVASALRHSRRPSVRGALRVLVFVSIGLFVARGVRWSEVVLSLRDVRVPLLMAVVALNACMLSVKAARLRLLLCVPRASWVGCFTALLTSSAINNVVPLRGGDVARLWMLARHAGVSKSAAIGVAIVENLFDILTLAMLACPASFLARGGRWATLVSVIVIAVAVFLLAVLGRLGAADETRDATPAPPGTGGAATLATTSLALRIRFGSGVRSLRRWGVVTTGLGLSIAAWACETAMVVLCARAMGLAIGPALALLVLLGINLAVALPSLPASAGPFEGATVLVLALSGFSKPSSVAFALLFHAVHVVPVTLAGGIVALRMGLPLRSKAESAAVDGARQAGE